MNKLILVFWNSILKYCCLCLTVSIDDYKSSCCKLWQHAEDDSYAHNLLQVDPLCDIADQEHPEDLTAGDCKWCDWVTILACSIQALCLCLHWRTSIQSDRWRLACCFFSVWRSHWRQSDKVILVNLIRNAPVIAILFKQSQKTWSAMLVWLQFSWILNMKFRIIHTKQGQMVIQRKSCNDLPPLYINRSQ